MKIDELMYNPIAWVVLSFCTIAALAFAVFTWFKGKKRREISFVLSTFGIVRGGVNVIEGFKLLYDNVEIENLTVSKLAIWNSGNETINSADIVTAKPLRISCTEDMRILSSKIITENEESNLFHICYIDEKNVNIVFDYIDPKNGVVVQLLHTGYAKDINVEGKIKSGKLLARSYTPSFPKSIDKFLDTQKKEINH